MKQFITAIVLLAAILARAAGVEASVDRDSAPENEPFYFILTIEGELDDHLQLPPLKNGRWLTNLRQNSTRIVNGRVSRGVGIGVVGTAPGKLVIPAFPVKVDGEELMTRQLEVEIVPLSEMAVGGDDEASVPFKEAVSGEFAIPDGRQSYYVGETIPVRITVYALESLHPRLIQLPEIAGVDDLISRSYTWSDGRTASFAEPAERSAVHNGRRCLKFEFRTELRPLKPGRVEPKASLTLNLAMPDREERRPFGFGFGFGFDDFNYQPYKLTLPAPEPFEVKPLPPAPQGVVNLGLVGDWKLSGSFDRNPAKAGEALTFTLKLEGSGSADTLTAPKLAFDNLRVFPPEVQKEEQEIRIRYAIVPLKPGGLQKNLRFATFNPATGNYSIHELPLKLTIEKSDLPLTPGDSTSDAASEPTGPEAASPRTPAARRAVPHRLRREPGCGVKLPLLRNAIPLAAGIVLAAGVLALAMELAARKRLRAAHDPEYRRARHLKKETPKLIAKLKAARAEEEFRQLMADAVYPLLAEALHLPPGATPGEIASRIEEPDLRKLLEEEAASEFMPIAAREARFSREKVELLIRGLKKYAFLLLAVLFAFPAAGSDPFERGNAAFAAGNYETALQEYRRMLNDREPAPGVLCNLGEAAYQLGDLPLAKGYFERARRLSPRDPDLAAELQQIDEQLKLATPEIARLSRWRDYLRPDHYLLLGAAALAAGMLATALRRCLPTMLVRIALAAMLAVAILSAAAIASQLNSSFHPDRAIVIGRTLELRSLPGEANGGIVATVPGGSEARILDRNGGFVRISADGQDGWAPSGSVMPIY